MDREKIIKDLQGRLEAADVQQQLRVSDNMSETDKLEFQYYQGQIDMLSAILVDYIAESSGI